MDGQSSNYILLTGPLLIGALASYLLAGIYAQQLVFYFQEFWRKDHQLLTALVVFVTAVETVQLVFTTHTTFQLLATGYGHPEGLTYPPWSSSALPLLNGLAAFAVQLLFAWRVHQLSRQVWGKVLAALICLTGATQCAAAVVVTVQFITFRLNTDVLPQLKTATTIWVAGGATCDLLITVGIVTPLLIDRRSHFKESKDLVNQIISNTIENMAVTTLCGIVLLALYLVYPNTFLSICMVLIIGHLYANVLLTTLNSRVHQKDNAAMGFGSNGDPNTASVIVTRTRAVYTEHNGIKAGIHSDHEMTALGDSKRRGESIFPS